MDKTLLRLYKQVSEEFDIPAEHIMDAETDFWKGVKEVMASENGQDIMINEFMNFELDVPAIKRKINMLRQINPSSSMHKMAVHLIDRYESKLNNKVIHENRFRRNPI